MSDLDPVVPETPVEAEFATEPEAVPAVEPAVETAEPVAPVVPPLSQPDEAEAAKLAEIDKLASDLSSGSLELGWAIQDLYHMVFEDFMEAAGGKPRKALVEFLTFIQEREAKDVASRSIITERFRIAECLPRKNYDKIVAASGGYKPTFNQIRSVIMTKDGTLDVEKTEQMIDFAVENQWPAVLDIRAYKNKLEPEKVKVNPIEKRWDNLRKVAVQVVGDYAADSPRAKAAQSVLDVWKSESHLEPEQPELPVGQ
jgi:hypothetical protein